MTSREEIAEVLPSSDGQQYFVVKNVINETSFFDWHPEIQEGYFKLVKNAVEVTIPKLNELAYEQVELGGVPFSTFIANKTLQGQNADYSLVLRGYVRTWLAQINAEYDRIHLIDRLAGNTGFA